MNCKNCGHEIWEANSNLKGHINEICLKKSQRFYCGVINRKKPMIGTKEICGCSKPEPEKEVKE